MPINHNKQILNNLLQIQSTPKKTLKKKKHHLAYSYGPQQRNIKV